LGEWFKLSRYFVVAMGGSISRDGARPASSKWVRHLRPFQA
jgi:hypothetical protein